MRPLRDIAALALCVALAVLASWAVSGCKRPEPKAAASAPAVAPPPAPAHPVVQAPAAAVPQPAQDVRGVPQNALRFRADLIRNARTVWGLDAPCATFAAQVHQESGWRPDAKSPVGAAGMAQFMPATGAWISRLFPELIENEPYNPGWALRALTTYDKWLWDRVSGRDACQRMAMALSAYNGGLGWVQRDKALAVQQGDDPSLWFDAVEKHNAGRSAAAFRENRGYPRRILGLLEQRYVRAGFGQGVCRGR